MVGCQTQRCLINRQDRPSRHLALERLKYLLISVEKDLVGNPDSVILTWGLFIVSDSIICFLALILLNRFYEKKEWFKQKLIFLQNWTEAGLMDLEYCNRRCRPLAHNRLWRQPADGSVPSGWGGILHMARIEFKKSRCSACRVGGHG